MTDACELQKQFKFQLPRWSEIDFLREIPKILENKMFNNFGTKPLEIFQKWLNLSQRRKNEESRNSKIP